MYATGVTKRYHAKCAPIWSIASSPESAAKRFQMTGRWETWHVNWGRKRSNNCIGGWWRSHRKTRLQRVVRCGWIHGGGDRHPLSDRQHFAGRRRPRGSPKTGHRGSLQNRPTITIIQDVDFGARAATLGRCEQCLERGKEAASHSIRAARLVAAQDSEDHRCPARNCR